MDNILKRVHDSFCKNKELQKQKDMKKTFYSHYFP